MGGAEGGTPRAINLTEFISIREDDYLILSLSLTAFFR